MFIIKESTIFSANNARQAAVRIVSRASYEVVSDESGNIIKDQYGNYIYKWIYIFFIANFLKCPCRYV